MKTVVLARGARVGHVMPFSPDCAVPAGDSFAMRSTTLALAANATQTLNDQNVSPTAAYGDVTLGQYAHLILDGGHVSFKQSTLERLGSRVIELANGARDRKSTRLNSRH